MPQKAERWSPLSRPFCCQRRSAYRSKRRRATPPRVSVSPRRPSSGLTVASSIPPIHCLCQHKSWQTLCHRRMCQRKWMRNRTRDVGWAGDSGRRTKMPYGRRPRVALGSASKAGGGNQTPTQSQHAATRCVTARTTTVSTTSAHVTRVAARAASRDRASTRARKRWWQYACAL